MADTPHPNVRSSSTSIIGTPGIISSGMFSGAQTFTVTGHTLQNITYAAPTEPTDYRTIPLGDIDVQHEIRVDGDTGVVYRRPADRRVYSAILQGQTVTVAMYQGNGAAEKWRQEIGAYMSLRHPNIIQIYGTASSSGIHATIYHDLIPFEHWLDPYKPFPCLTVYIYSYYHRQYRVRMFNLLVTILSAPQEAADYLRPILKAVMSWDCTMWIRRRTGRLCVDLMHPQKPIDIEFISFSQASISGSEAAAVVSGYTPRIMEGLAINVLTLEAYHEVCHWSLGQISSIAIPAGMTIHLGMVISRPSNNHFAKIAFLPEADDYAYGWRHSGQVEGEIMENGSTRFNIRDAVGCTLWLSFRTGGPWPWLSQSNCLFKRCQITSNFQDYVLVRLVRFYVTVSETAEELPTGFLFLCPRDNLCTAPSSACSPTCPAYWSLDPLGAHPLSTEEAIELGFPAVHYSVDITGRSWDSSVYAGLRRFYLAKGFDPYSQDVARHFGYPLYRLSGDIDPVFAHVVEEEDNPEVEDDLDSPMDVDHVDTENHGDDSEDLSDMELDS